MDARLVIGVPPRWPGARKWRTAVAVAFLAVGAALRFWQYLANASLWVDEAAVARNVVDRPVLGLLAPLDYGQVAPWGFLFVEKLSVTIFGNNEYALRLFPLLCGLASLPLMYVVAKQMQSGLGTIIAVGMFALGIPFVFFSSQVKPYSCDVAAALVVVILALDTWLSGRRGAAVASGLLGAALPWFSNASVFMLAGVGAALVLEAVLDDDKPRRRRTLLTVTLWSAGALLAVIASRSSMTGADRAFMQQYWAAGFAPVPPHNIEDVLWPWRRIVAAFAVFSNAPPALDGGMHYRNPIPLALLSVVGLWALWRKGWELAAFVALPIGAALAAAESHLYPFSGRVAVWIVPLLLLACAAGAEEVERVIRRLAGPVSLLVPAFVVALAVQAIVRNAPPDKQEDMKSVLSYVSSRRTSSDSTYVYYGAGQAFIYYASRYAFHSDEYTVGSCARHEPHRYLAELDRFRGQRRLWTVFSHSTQNGKEIRFMTAYLTAIGREIEKVPNTNAPLGAGSYAFLYDLSDARRLANASAGTFAVPSDEPDSSWLCYGTMTPVAKRASAGRAADLRWPITTGP